jgi:hypothetical protein
MADPVSWFVIERGWTVLAAEGEEVGTVDEVVGDSGVDIFDGLTFKTGPVSAARYVPAEQVSEIVDGRVTLKLPAEAAKQLAPYEQPAEEEEILPETASRMERLVGWLRGGRR